MSDDFQDSMMEIFVFETTKFLNTLEEILLENEGNNEGIISAVPEIFRIMHTIKSSSAMMSLDNISKLSHKIEDLFFYIRENDPQNIDKAKLTDIVLDGVDFIKNNLDGSAGEDPSEKIKFIGAFLDEIKSGKPAQADTSGQPEPPVTAEPAPPPDSMGLMLNVKFKSDCQMLGLRAFEIINRVKGAVPGTQSIPDDTDGGEDDIKRDGLLLILDTDKPFAELQALICKSPFVESVTNAAEPVPEPESTQTPKPAPAPAPTPAPAEPAAPEREDRRAVERRQDPSGGAYVNVETSKLDYLIDTMGEILVAQMELAHAINDLDLDKSSVKMSSLKKLVLSMQEAALSLRMVPVKETFQKMNRIVRDICRKQEKDVAFVTAGEDTEVDRGIVDMISSPLMHIIRNSVDHGIEDPETRIAAGKPEKGRVELAARTEGRNVVITVSDDGKGFDTARIRDKAIASGKITREQAASMSPEDINALVFLPGFSTKQEVTEFSGRGVGMDVVNENIKKTGGNVVVFSEQGLGSRVVMKIPLTLAIIEAVVIRVGDQTCALPVTSVREVFSVSSEENIRRANGGDVVLLRNECYNIVNLFDFYSFDDRLPYSDGIMVVIKSDSGPFVLFANEIIDRQDVVVKPAPALFKNIRGISGCTILGDGGISLILDPGELKKRN